MRKTAEPGFGGDAYLGPQAQNDIERGGFDNLPLLHDPAETEPGSGDYNFFYGGGQLHVSPHHDHDQLRGHAGVAGDHHGPLAVGHVSVDRGRATWHATSTVSLRGIHRVLKDYTKNVGWQWGGLTDLEGQPIDDDFAPKKSLYLRDNETGEKISFTVQGRTAHVAGLSEEQRAAVVAQGYKLAEYPGGTNMNDRMDNYAPMGEDLETENLGANSEELDAAKSDTPTGTFRCPECGEVFNRWNAYLLHREEELPDGEGETDQSGFPPAPNMDLTLPQKFHDRMPFVMPLASVKDAERYEEFEDWADFLGLRAESARHYGAFRGGECVGLASVDRGNLRYLGGRTVLDRASLLAALQVHYGSLDVADEDANADDLRSAGFVRTASGYRWAAGQAPKDMIDRPVPFIYDIQEDRIVTGAPGQRTTDLEIPGKFTPGGIVEGEYLPGGKVHIHTMTNMPYSVRHMLDLWYWSPTTKMLEVTGVELHDAAGNKTRLARISAVDVGNYIKTLAMTDPAVWNAYQALRKAGGTVYVVGGAVRDALLQKEPKDIDLMVVGVAPEKVHAILGKLPGRMDLTGKDFGVYRYNYKGHEVEVALPRTERSTGDRRVDFDVQVDHTLPVEDDLLRRDFTVNAMAVDLDSGRLVDPYDGARDIEERRLRTVHPASFEEDPTRLLRGLVAHARHGLSPDESTRQQMGANAYRLGNEARERIQAELDKLFKSGRPAEAIRLGHETGILKHVFPEVADNFDFDQNNPHHNYTLGEHLLNVLENVSAQSSDPDLRLAGLLHDIGKPASAWTNPETGFNHYYKGPDGQGDDHETVGAGMAEQRLRALKYPVARIKRIQHLIQHHMWSRFSSPKGARKFLHNVGDDHADDLLTLRWADEHGKGQTPAELAARTSVDTMRGLVEQVRSKQQPTTQSALAINGNDIMALGVKPGPAIGRILRQLTDDVVEDPSLNTPEALKARAQEYINALV